MSKTLLFAFGNRPSLRLQILVASRLQREGWTPTFLYWSSNNDEYLAALAEIGSRWPATRLHEAEGSPGRLLRAKPKLHSWKARALSLLLVLPPFRESAKIVGYHFANVEASLSILRKLDPTVVVVSEDGISSNLHFMTAVRELGVPCVDIPYGFGVREDLEIDLERKQNTGELQMAAGAEGAVLSIVAPQWIKKGRFSGALMFPQHFILGMEAVGITVGDPWIIHGGHANRLCAESNATLSRYRKEGIADRKLVLTGSPYCDEMMESLAGDERAKCALKQPQRISEGALRVLASWPPSYHGSRATQCEFGSYEEMTLNVLGMVREIPGVELTVSLHPATTRGIRELLLKAGINVSDEYVIGLIPRNDVFVTYYSSTIRWAIAAGKPVINYDAYNLNLDIYDSAKGYSSTTRARELQEMLAELASQPGEFEAVASGQCESASDWGILDGRCTERIGQELMELARQRGGPHSSAHAN